MNDLHIEKKMNWLRIESDVNNEIDRLDRLTEHRGQEAEDTFVMIGQWDYYLYAVHGKHIELHRTQRRFGQPTLTEVVTPGHYAISDEDLACAVRYWTGGTYQPGCYRISPLIERKLRIHFE